MLARSLDSNSDAQGPGRFVELLVLGVLCLRPIRWASDTTAGPVEYVRARREDTHHECRKPKYKNASKICI